jgi:hypothetical protein
MGGMMATPKPESKQDAAAELLLKRGKVDVQSKDGTGHAVPWATVPTREERLAALPPLPDSGSAGAGSPADGIAHNPAPTSDRRGAFTEQGSSGRNRVNRSGHKP